MIFFQFKTKYVVMFIHILKACSIVYSNVILSNYFYSLYIFYKNFFNIYFEKFLKMENLHIRYYIQMRVNLGNDAISIHNDFKIVKRDQAPSYSTIQRWVKHFKEGEQQLKDKPRSGRPITATTKTNIELVRNVIDDNPYCSYDEIEAQTSLSRGTIQNIIHNELKLKKIASRFVPYNLSEKNKKDRVSMCRENLLKIESGRWRLCDIITGDESWFYWRQIGKKQSNASWVAEDEKPIIVVR